MCLYVYYHGNNLHRFGFVRGALPTEEERNQGLSYGEILEHLSENDREFFTGSGYSAYESVDDINIKQRIEERGLVSVSDLRNEADADRPKVRSPLDRMSPYDRKIYDEMRQAEIESRAFQYTTITKLIINEGIKTIGHFAFVALLKLPPLNSIVLFPFLLLVPSGNIT